jgi:hypothetical protein
MYEQSSGGAVFGKELPQAIYGHQGRQMCCSTSRKYCGMTNKITQGTGHSGGDKATGF